MRSLVTGGAGFIGSNLVDALVKRGDEVIVLDNFSTGKEDNLKTQWNNITISHCDVYYDLIRLYQAAADVDVIYHLAADISAPESLNNPSKTHIINVDGTFNILMVAKQLGCKVVFASSSAVYGNNNSTLIGETETLNPITPYGGSKAIGEMYCKTFSEAYNIPTVCLRFFNVFGPRQDPKSPYAAAIPLFVDALKNDRSPIIFGDGSQTRSFTYIDDIVNTLILAGDKQVDKNIIMNVSSNYSITINNLVKTIQNIMGKENIEIEYKPTRRGDILRSAADTRKAAYFGIDIKTSLEDGLKKTVEYYENA